MDQPNEPIAFTQNQREELRLLGDKASTLSSQPGTHQQTYIAEPVIPFTKTSFGQYASGVGTLRATGGDVGGGSETLFLVPIAFMMREDAVNNTFHAKEVDVALCLQALRPAVTSHHAQNLIVQPEAYILDSFTSNSMLSDNPNSGCRKVDQTKCLDTSCLNPTCHQGGVMVVQKLYENHPNDSRVSGPLDVAPTVVSRYGTGGGNIPLVNTEPKSHWDGGETHPTLNQAAKGSGAPGYSNQELFSQGGAGLVPAIPIQDGRELEKHQNGMGVGKPGDPAYTLDTTGAQAVATPAGFISDKVGTLTVGHGSSAGHQHRQGDNSFLINHPQVIRESGPGYWMEDDKAGTLRAEGENRPSRPSHVVGVPLAVDTFNQTLSPTNQTLRAGTDVDRMGAVLEPVVKEGEVMPTLTARMQGSTGWAPYNETAHLIPHIVQASELRLAGQITPQDTCPTLLANNKSGDNTPLMVSPVIAPTITTCKGSKAGSSSEAIDELIAMHDAQQDFSAGFKWHQGAQAGSIGYQEGQSPTLTTDKAPGVVSPIAFQPGNLCRQAGAAPSTELFPTVKCDTGDQSLHVAQGVDLYNQTMTGDIHVPLRTAGGHGAPATIAPTLTASNDPSRSPQSSEVTQQVQAVHKVAMAVRRLTPRECERLQGFPDDWSKIPWKGKPVDECPDGPRYKACGNSMAVPVMRWIGQRINAKHQELYGEQST